MPYKQHQLSANKYAIALTHLISLFTEWPSYFRRRPLPMAKIWSISCQPNKNPFKKGCVWSRGNCVRVPMESPCWPLTGGYSTKISFHIDALNSALCLPDLSLGLITNWTPWGQRTYCSLVRHNPSSSNSHPYRIFAHSAPGRTRTRMINTVNWKRFLIRDLTDCDIQVTSDLWWVHINVDL